ncbi:MAG: YfhO family protein, partial [Pseudomonadota bacterium]
MVAASVAWHIVLHLFLGGAGLYCFCRIIGTSREAAFLAGALFALAPEMVSLINAGHVLKIATIGIAPWAFYFLEKGFQRRRVIWFMTTGLVLALQFFYSHWQIAYYTCLAVGIYGIIRMVLILREEQSDKAVSCRLIGMNLVTLFFFLSTVAISLMPLAKWSTDTNRGVQSGANQGKGGLNRDEAMSWSMPPEELGAFVVPGFFGFSRQEAGPNPTNIRSYYWGRMVFTQTTSYFGLLPWLLLPLPLIFRRDRYTLLAMLAVVGGIIFSMGKYTFIYNLLFDYFPGINRFRVPKMMMFMPVIGLGVMAARGLDILRDEKNRAAKAFRHYLTGIAVLPVALLLFLVSLKLGKVQWLSLLTDMITQPTRYEQGAYLVDQRWGNILYETGIATALSALYATAILAGARGLLSTRLLPLALVAILMLDVGRVNNKFMFLTDVPIRSTGSKTPTVEFLSKQTKQYRVLPLGLDPAYFSSNNIPTVFTSLPVQQVCWQEIIDSFSLDSAMVDMLNIRYLVLPGDTYRQEQQQFAGRYAPVFTSPDNSEVVLENRNVLPKAWLVSSAFVVGSRMQTLQILQNPAFNPGQVALVESPPPIQLAAVGQSPATVPENVTVDRYEGERIDLTATAAVNSLLVLGEKYYQGWKAQVDGKDVDIHPVNNILRGVYLTPGTHRVEFRFDPLPFKIGKYLT